MRHPSARDQSPLIRLCIGFDFGICSSAIAKSSFQDQQYAASMTQLSSNSSASALKNNPEIPKLSKINPIQPQIRNQSSQTKPKQHQP